MQATLTRTIDVFLEGASKPLIVILGPTAAGKTAVSLEVARHIEGLPRATYSACASTWRGAGGALRGEIVNADSRQLYQYLDIGTAKIARGEMQGIPHHLLSLRDPEEEVTVGRYQEEALKVIEDILERQKVPLVVGGSMLYVSSIIDGLTLAPAADPALRKRLEEEYDGSTSSPQAAVPLLYKRLQSVDPDAAAAIHPGNKAYVVRAVEIYETLKQPKSKSVKEHKPPYDLLILGITRPKGELQKRIEERVEEMFARGWLDEVRDLLARGYCPSDPGMRSHGYREICQYIEEVEADPTSLEAEFTPSLSRGGAGDAKERLKQRIITKTRQYAKRQMSWWRGDRRIHWVNLT